jgi:hypothetical protein
MRLAFGARFTKASAAVMSRWNVATASSSFVFRFIVSHPERGTAKEPFDISTRILSIELPVRYLGNARARAGEYGPDKRWVLGRAARRGFPDRGIPRHSRLAGQVSTLPFHIGHVQQRQPILEAELVRFVERHVGCDGSSKGFRYLAKAM